MDGGRAAGGRQVGKFLVAQCFLAIFLKFFLKFGTSIHHHKAQNCLDFEDNRNFLAKLLIFKENPDRTDFWG
jgi:hypothetical protein